MSQSINSIGTSHLKKRFEVFISSTFEDLKAERAELGKSLSEFEYIVEGMELFPAADNSQWDIIRNKIAEADIFVLIIGDKYGSLAPKTLEPELQKKKTISYTHLEFRYAISLGKPILAILKSPRIADEKVDAFIKEVQNSDLYTKNWASTSELVKEVIKGLENKMRDEKFTSANGWVRASDICAPQNLGDKSVSLLTKTQYIKLISYSRRTEGSAPLYRKFIPRLNREVPVWDEYVMLTVNHLSHFVDHFQHYNRTQGDAVDLTNVFPFVNKVTFTDENAGVNPQYFNPDIRLPSNLYVHASSFYNGFQHGNMDLGVKALKRTGKLRVMVDMTSIPGFQDLFMLLQCVFVGADKNVKDITQSVQMVQPGIYLTEVDTVDEDAVIKYKFDLKETDKYVFAYGSLINLESASKTLGRTLTRDDIAKATLKRYERTWTYQTKIYSDKLKKTINGVFLNLAEKENSSVPGIVFKVTNEELEKLKLREKYYELADVTTNTDMPADKTNARVYTFICGDKEHLSAGKSDSFIMQNYSKMVEDGCMAIDKDFYDLYKAGSAMGKHKLIEDTYRFE